MSTAVALPRLGAAASRLRFVTYELALWLALYPVYLAIRGLSIDSYGTALANARDLISVERSLSIFHEERSGTRCPRWTGRSPPTTCSASAMPSMHVGWSLLVGIFGSARSAAARGSSPPTRS